MHKEAKCTNRRQISSAFLHCGHWVPLFLVDGTPSRRSGCADNLSAWVLSRHLSAWVLRHRFRHKETKCTRRRQISSAFLHCGHWVPLFLVDGTPSRRSGCADNLSAWVLRHHFRHKEAKCTRRRQISSAFLHCGHWVPLFLVDGTPSRRSGCADNLSAWVLRHHFRHKEAKCTKRRQISSAFLHCGHWVPLFLVDATPVSAIRLRRQSLRLGLATPLPSQGGEMYEQTTNLLGFPTLRSLGSALSCRRNAVSAIRLRRQSLRLGLATPLPS